MAGVNGVPPSGGGAGAGGGTGVDTADLERRAGEAFVEFMATTLQFDAIIEGQEEDARYEEQKEEDKQISGDDS